MGNCKDCKYFKRLTGKNDNKMFGRCVCDKFLYFDIDDYHTDLEKEKIRNDMLLYWDYETYNADFYVGENFGCIHFTKKEEI